MRFIPLLLLTMISPLNADLIKTLEPFIESKRIGYQAPGLAVSIVKGDKVLFVKGYGLNAIDGQEKVNGDTIFQLASVTKTFTAAGLGIQVQDKRMTWDDEIISHLPAFALKEPYSTRFANARDLLAHRTGLPAFGGDLLGKLGYKDAEILARVRLIDPNVSFRERAQYSNVGYFVAGELLAALTGASWSDAIQKTILTPLQMNRSGFASNLDSANVASSHALIDGKVVKIEADRTGGFPAAGAITSTATDMTKWMTLFLSGKDSILTPDTIQELFTPAIVGEISFTEAPPISKETGFNFALGWDTYYYKGHQIVEKGGGLDGVRTLVTLIPELQMGITILTNLNLTLLPESIRAKFLEEVIAKSEIDLQKEIAANQDKLMQMIQPEEKPKTVLPMAHKPENYTGNFASELYGKFSIESENKNLIVKAGPDGYKGTLTHWSNDTFMLSWPAINSGNQQITFTFGPTGKATGFTTETLGTFKSE